MIAAPSFWPANSRWTGWHATIGDPTYADAILDRLVHNAIRLPLKGKSRRKPETNGEINPGGDAKTEAKK